MNSAMPGGEFSNIVEQIDTLPPLPYIVTELIKVINSPESSADDAARVIQNDPAVTSKVLRMANSAFYGIPKSVSSVSSAVVILGFNTIRSFVLGSSFVNLFSSSDINTGQFDINRFWSHSVVCAMTARDIVFISGNMDIDPEGSFCAGMLHDIGKLIFRQFIDEYDKVEKEINETGLSASRAEDKILGMNHTRIGTTISDRWGLPLDLEYAIVNHHNPSESDKLREIVSTVHLADYFCHNSGNSVYEKESCPELCEEAFEYLKIDEGKRERIEEKAENNMGKAEEFLSLLKGNG